MAYQRRSFEEIVYNEVLSGKKLLNNGVLVTIDSIQIEPRSRQIIVGTVEGDKFTCFKDDVFDFEVLVANHKPSIKTNKKRNKGKKR